MRVRRTPPRPAFCSSHDWQTAKLTIKMGDYIYLGVKKCLMQLRMRDLRRVLLRN